MEYKPQLTKNSYTSHKSIRFSQQLRSKVPEEVDRSPSLSSNTSFKKNVITYPKEIPLSQHRENYYREFGLTAKKETFLSSNSKMLSSNYGGIFSDRTHPQTYRNSIPKIQKRNLTMILQEKYEEAKSEYYSTIQLPKVRKIDDSKSKT